jgi:hypothetical protein
LPAPEHYLPLFYTLGAAYDDEPVSFFNDGIAFKSISMLGVSIGHAQAGAGVATRSLIPASGEWPIWVNSRPPSIV